MTASTPTPWHEAFPAPSNPTPPSIAASTLLGRLQAQRQQGADSSLSSFLLIDLRRIDHEGGTIRTSLNLPAQTLFYSLPTLYRLSKDAGISEVIFYCGSSRGRGTRAAGWFEDYLREQGDEGKKMKSLILEGGIKGWVKGGSAYVEEMDGYAEEVWKQQGKE